MAVGTVEEENILHICAQRRVSPTLFKTIVDKLSVNNKATLMMGRDSDENLPLHLAARTNKDESYISEGLINEMKQIKRSGGSSNSAEQDSSTLDIFSIKNRLGKTAAHIASEQGHVHILKLMWDEKSAVAQKNQAQGLYATDNNRFTCLHLAAMNGNDEGKQFCILQSIFD
jgi:ankyrin repeat protein